MKSTVILVHGTFAAPKKGANWYQPQMETTASPNFVARLDAELAWRGRAVLGPSAPEGEAVFHWSGNNSWTDRAEAARSLADYVDELHREGWKCHIVAHSHGGNVAVEALPRIKARESVASVVTMGRLFFVNSITWFLPNWCGAAMVPIASSSLQPANSVLIYLL